MQKFMVSTDQGAEHTASDDTDRLALPRVAWVLTRLIRDVHRLLHRTADALLVNHGVTYVESHVLLIISCAEEAPISPSRIVEMSGEKATNVTRITDRLYEKCLIERAANTLDRRKVALSITPKGLQLLHRVLPDLSGLMESQVHTLMPHEQRQLETLLVKMFSGLS